MKNKNIEKALKPFGTPVHTTGNNFNYQASFDVQTADPEVIIHVSWSYVLWDFADNVEKHDIDSIRLVTNRALAQKDWHEDGYPGSWKNTIKDTVATLTAMQERMKQSMEDRKAVQA